jgi:hypothetical protein
MATCQIILDTLNIVSATQLLSWHFALISYHWLTIFVGFDDAGYDLLQQCKEGGRRLCSKEEENIVTLDHIDVMQLGGISRQHKMKMISQELKARLEKHKATVEQWSEDVVWLWGQCQPLPNKPHINQWHDLIERIAAQKKKVAVEEELEAAAIDVQHLDGEDANEEWIDETDLAGLEEDLEAATL